jgi:hypothetical protein
MMIPGWAVRSVVDRLAVRIEGDHCTNPTIEFVYEKRPGVWQPLDRTMTLAFEPRNMPVTIIFPAIYRATQNFRGLVVSQKGCVITMSRLLQDSRLPSILTIVLPNNWDTLPFHQTFGSLIVGHPAR